MISEQERLQKELEIFKQNIQKLQDAGIIVEDLLSDLQETLEKKLEEELGKAPSGQATPVAVKSSATKSAANVKKNAHNVFPVTNQSSAKLTKEELDLLLRIDNATTYSFTEYACLGDLHERIEVILQDKGPERTASVTMTGREIRKRLQDIEREREMVEKEREEQRRNYYQKQHEISQKLNNENLTDAQREKIYEKLRNLESACFPSITWQKSNALIQEKEKLARHRNLSDTQTAQIEYSYTILGQYIRPASRDANPQVILYLESIRKCTKPNENKYHIAQIYLHEMFHAYFDANPYGTDYYIAKVEEPITELGALDFIDSFANSYNDNDFIELARNNVELKKYNPAISFYSFGLYLFTAGNGKTFVQNWYDKRSSIDASSQQVQGYEDLFRIGYPENETTALSKLDSIFQ